MQVELRFIDGQYPVLSVEYSASDCLKLSGAASLALQLFDFILKGRIGQQLHLCQPEQTEKQKQCAQDYENFDSLIVHIICSTAQRRPKRGVFIRIHQTDGKNKNGPTRAEYSDVPKRTAYMLAPLG